MEYNVDLLRGDILNEENILYIQNDLIKLGLNLELGGAVTYFAEHGRRNMINSQDWGRQVQLSFYGGPKPYCPEGVEMQEKWKHCGWNPIQSGDWFFNRAKVIDCKAEDGRAYIKCIPMQWALNNCPGECTFELWFTLEGKTVNVTARLNNQRPDESWYGPFGQELPAVYSNGEWYRLVTYVGKEPFTNGPLTEVIGRESEFSWPPRVIAPTENWVALLDDKDYGLGIYQPLTNQFSVGFSGGLELMGKGGPKDGQTGAVSPTLIEILDHDIQYTFHYSLIAGQVEDIRREVVRLEGRENRKKYTFEKDRNHFYYQNARDKGYGKQDCLDFDFEKGSQLCAPMVFVAKKDCNEILLEAAFDQGEVIGQVEVSLFDGSLKRLWELETETVEFRFTGTGEKQLYRIDLSAIGSCYIAPKLIFDTTGHARIYSFEMK